MPAFQNVIDLRFAVSDLVNDRTISDVFPRLISMAEDDINSELRTRYQIADTTLTFDEGVSALPPGFLELVAVDPTRGRNHRYAIDAFNITIPTYTGDLDIQYYAEIPSLTCSPTATNWLLKKFPNVYLYGVGRQAAHFLRNVELAAATGQLYAEALRTVKVDDERARYAGTTIRVQGMTP